MKGDFSRIRFNPAKQYSAVLKQQGRVDLDSDANEQSFIDGYLRDLTNVDVIGRYGGPEGDAGFAIKIEGGKIWIGPGRYYVEGILVENPRWTNYDEQPYLIDPTYSASELLNAVGTEVAAKLVLQVWQRLVTDLDDPCLQEPALGQADTTVRLQTVWRVVGSLYQTKSGGTSTAPATGPIAQLSPCCQALYTLPRPARDGEMGADTSQSGSDCGCQPIAAAGYQGLENQLYRVEIHTAGDLNTATFKWSRENGSVVAAITNISNQVVTVTSLGPDANLGFQAGQWVELCDDTYQFGEVPNQPGILYQILSVNQATLQVTMTTSVIALDTTKNARMRRWDQSGALATPNGIALSSSPIPLENGIEVNFRAGQFQSGDYWTIPARTASGQIDWPPCGGNGRHFQPPDYMQVFQAPLACVRPRFGFYQAATNTSSFAAAAPKAEIEVSDAFLLETASSYETETGLNAATNVSTETNLNATANQFVNDNYAISDCRLLFPPLTALNAEAETGALHVSSVTWTNDDIMTVDALLEKGFSVTFDQPTTCPWGGGNFQVTLEVPYGVGDLLATIEGQFPGITKPTFPSPPGTDSFLRTPMVLDPPWGITVSGNTVSWITPVSTTAGAKTDYGAYFVLGYLNILLGWLNPTGFGRVRVKLIGGAVYGNGASGNIYLDGLSFGATGKRTLDGSQCVNYNLPSGDSLTASDYDSWFYLAPTVAIASVVIQGVENGVEKTVPAIKILIGANNQVTGIQTGETQSIPITGLRALITLTYPPISPTTVSLLFAGVGAGTVITIASSVTIPAGQLTFPVPINVQSNPGAGTNTLTLIASVSTAVGPLAFNPAPTLAVTGSTPPTKAPAAAPPTPPAALEGGEITNDAK